MLVRRVGLRGISGGRISEAEGEFMPGIATLGDMVRNFNRNHMS
jgi:hypothetical protein